MEQNTLFQAIQHIKEGQPGQANSQGEHAARSIQRQQLPGAKGFLSALELTDSTFPRTTGRIIASALDGSTIRRNCEVNPGMAVVALRAELQQVCQIYTTTQSRDDDPIFDEMASFVILSFPEFAMSEIREAFRLAADGTIDTEESDLKAYFGVWSVASLGIILQAYRQYRKTIIAKFQMIESEAKVAALPAQAKQTTEDYERARVQRLKTDPDVMITVNDYSILRRHGLLEIGKDVWQRYLRQGIDQVKAEAVAALNGNGTVGEKMAARAALAAMDKDKLDDDLWGRIQAEAKRLAVKDWAAEAPF